MVKHGGTLMVLNLGDNLDVLAHLTENAANRLDIGAGVDEGGKDHVTSPKTSAFSFVRLSRLKCLGQMKGW